ncbi:uncharacterized protein BYT42DRAFT_490949 [Radiomyces spectabilis]|uniref:uncharacterized protein n=1 Tax=Radiomyces spectabilis TaxID=64574 RepID=UPI0022204DF8|nr:uncharacterized protein BYT42DRAFT_490949 [Radiomyces spectabilis]KAI8388771.1 hypothetical protein BYT42DRAFT_490949 [Radiomyces spectabilis]
MTHLIISKQRLLGACELKLEVYQELGGGKETTSIGNLTVNLSAYAEKGVTSDRYLLHDSKFNSTIKLTIRMNQKSDVGIQFQV